jgi:Cu+-exporting ATPase
MVYSLLNENGLCAYYDLNANPGTSFRHKDHRDKFAFLDDPEIGARLISFRDETQVHLTFYIPAVHCSSCLYLLEQLYRLNEGITSSRLNFERKELTVVLDPGKISLRQAAELLADTGYEPYFSLQNLQAQAPGVKRGLILNLGVAGFCFGNIMLLSFPEYLGIKNVESSLRSSFQLLSLVLSLPVVLYSATPFYRSAWSGLRKKFLNIDAPIALAILITFGRSVTEILTRQGSGYLDSLSGIVFFMLAGRVLQDKTYRRLSFDRDYKSYFPLAATVSRGERWVPAQLPELKAGDTLLIHHQELIPADGILVKGKALIDYSFVTGESIPVAREMGEIVYAGGRQTGSNIEVLLIKEVAQSHLTAMWSKSRQKNRPGAPRDSYIHLLSRYFTYIVLAIAGSSALYWAFNDPSRIANAVTGVLIIACPCALLLCSNLTNGNILRILARNRFYLRDAQAIDAIASVDHIVLDKTGTLTQPGKSQIRYEGLPLNDTLKQNIAAAVAHSVHPLSRALAEYLGDPADPSVDSFSEISGSGIEATFRGRKLRLGSFAFIYGIKGQDQLNTRVYVEWNGERMGHFSFTGRYRDDMRKLVRELHATGGLSVLSGDNEGERKTLEDLMGPAVQMMFNQQPEDKLSYLRQLQEKGRKVMMVGDGLNDGPALMQSDAGIAIAEDCNNFTPSSDGILDASRLNRLEDFRRLCIAGRKIIVGGFVFSLLYNLAGLFFAVRGELSPLTAAVLMPASSMSILLISFGCTSLAAKFLKL